jgi:flagellar hook-associated protein 2
MSTSLNSLSSVTANTTLDSSFVSLISNVMKVESAPLSTLTSQRDSATTQKAVYSDLKSTIDTLRTSTQALLSTNAFFDVKTGRKASLSGVYDPVLNASSTATVATVTASSSAAAGTYSLTNVTLARAQTLVSNQQAYGDQALGWEGSFVIGGLADRTAGLASGADTSTVASVSTGPVASGQLELGSGPYKVEVRQDPSSSTTSWQFRLVDEDGQAVTIQNGSQSGFGNSWQAIPTGTSGSVAYDTGRGLVLNFNSDTSTYKAASASTGATQAVYAAQGASISVAKTDSLVNIANKINAAAFADGNGVSATVVDSRLVLTSARTGVNHAIASQDGAGSSIISSLGLTQKQEAKDGSFYLNNMLVQRSRSTGLTNVIAGATINLASDAENKTATINITADNSKSKTAINTFIQNFNSTTDYIAGKTAVNKQSDGTYKRNALSGQTVFTSLRNDLFNLVNKNVSNSGSLNNLRQIGISLDDNLHLTVTDSDKLDKALLNDPNNVQALLDKVMSGVDDKLGYFAGTKGYVSQEMTMADSQVQTMNNRIDTLTTRLNKRQDNLVTQYSQLQAQLYLMQYTQQALSSVYSYTSKSG